MYQKCTFVGRLGADPTVNTLETGRKVAQIRVCCTERGFTRHDGKKVEERTEWIPVVLWGGLAETAERYLQKGAPVLIEGKFRTRNYEKNGVKHYVSEIYADNMVMLPNNNGGSGAPLPPDIYGGPAQDSSAYAPSGQAPSNYAPSGQAPSAQAPSAQAPSAKASPALQAATDKLANAFGAEVTAAGDDGLPF